ncbi:hypothetical protein BC834DRAFT_839725 [Gloeopeniophorella convolvens]|nr:hypothetical protein BC834DRAFT_839725 [Gloeopeniophorella convolvens]
MPCENAGLKAPQDNENPRHQVVGDEPGPGAGASDGKAYSNKRNGGAWNSAPVAKRIKASEAHKQHLEAEERAKREKERVTAAFRQKLVEIGMAANVELEDVDWALVPEPDQFLDPADPLDEWEDVEEELTCSSVDETLKEKALRDARLRAIISAFGGRRRMFTDNRTRLHRRRAATREWKAVVPTLVEPFLEWSHSHATTRQELEGDVIRELRVLGLTAIAPQSQVIRQRRDENVNVALMHAGLVPGTPVTPPSLSLSTSLPSTTTSGGVSLALAYKALSNPRALFKAYFPYVHTLEALFSNAFDVYCDVRRRVQRRVDVALKRDASNWRMKYGCPACGYKAAGTCDERAFESRLFLSRDFVNRFHGEVRSHAAARQSSQASQARVRAVEAEDGFALPEDQEDDRCGSNWKAANTKELPPASKEAFEQTGVFACLCRHGIVEFLIEFVQCGERAKHALAANYKQAYDLQRTLTRELTTYYQSTKYSPSDFIEWQKEEAAFLASAKRKEPMQNSTQYERLREDIAALDPFVTVTAEQYGSLSADSVQESKREALDRERRLLMGRLDRASKAVEDAERLLGVPEPWKYGDAKYTKTLEYINNRQFVRTVEELQGLVVSRLMELDRANLAGSETQTGYKLRKHIAQALSRRCTALRNAIDRYNTLAPQQRPPRPLLHYSEVLEYCSLSEFEILKHTDDDMLRKPWALRSNREAANRYFKLERAKEELVRCGIEAHRLHAWVDADDEAMVAAVENYEALSPAFTSHLKVIQATRQRVNDSLRKRLAQLYAIRGEVFDPRTVATGGGVGANSPPGASSPPADPWDDAQLHLKGGLGGSSGAASLPPADSTNDGSDDEDELYDEEQGDEVLRITDTLARIAVM